MKLNKFLSLLFIVISLAIAGCGSSNTKTISFDNFSMGIDQSYKELTDTELIENKQLNNKIIGAYKITNEGGFDQNIVITKTPMQKDINIDNLSLVNIEKLKSQLKGFSEIEQGSISFSCKSSDIKGNYINFSLSQNMFNTEKALKYMSQYYFVYNGQSYVISFATQDNTTLTAFKSNLKTLTCK